MNKNKVLLLLVGIVAVILGALLLQTILTKDAKKQTQEATSNINEGSVAEDETLPLGEVKGSCDLIDQASTCIEYYGSSWMPDAIEMVCEDGEYSSGPCAESSLGGCRMAIQSEAEMITWYYDSGGEPFTDNIQEINQACVALPNAAWVK